MIVATRVYTNFLSFMQRYVLLTFILWTEIVIGIYSIRRKIKVSAYETN